MERPTKEEVRRALALAVAEHSYEYLARADTPEFLAAEVVALPAQLSLTSYSPHLVERLLVCCDDMLEARDALRASREPKL